jgi:dsRNA-specific ribonuclease
MSYNTQNNNRFRKNIRDPVIIPYNPNNKLIKDVDLKEMMNNYDIKLDIINIELYRKALTHKSYIKKEFYNKNFAELEKAKQEMGNVLELREESNERLEFLGDTVIKSVIAEYLFERYPLEDEGFMTRLKTKIENRESLARFARIIGLDEFIIISSQNEDSNIGRTNDKILEDAIESFIAAIYLDNTYVTCKKFIRNLLENQVDWSDLIFNDTNYKDQIQRYYHSIKWEHPQFKLLKEEQIPNNKKLFTIGVMDNNKHVIATATDSSKKKAEQKASKIALYKFKQLNDFQMNDEDYDCI